MNVIGHQAIRPNPNPTLRGPLGHRFQVGRVVFLAEERLLPPIAALRNVVRQTRITNLANLAMPGIY
jgi:hypothetical protein